MRFVFEMLLIYFFLQNESVSEKKVKVFPKRKKNFFLNENVSKKRFSK